MVPIRPAKARAELKWRTGHSSFARNLLVEPPHPAPPETSRLQHTVVFLCILACVVMLLFYL